MNEEIDIYLFKSIIYVSKADEKITHQDILDILTQSWKFNHNSYISGMLVYDNGYFIQLIQGPIKTIDKLYARISNDTRHHSLKKIGEEKLHVRDCTGWGIGVFDGQEIAESIFQALDIGHGKELYNADYQKAKSLLLELKSVL